MYAVVGCSECQALWLVEGRPERSECPRCGTTKKHEKRRQFVTTEDEDHARDIRASMLAARQGQSDAFADLGSFAELEAQTKKSGIDDGTYLAESGVDPERVTEAVERETASKPRKTIVREGIDELTEPTETRIVEFASRHDVSPAYTKRTLRKLVEAGEATESRGVYRLL